MAVSFPVALLVGVVLGFLAGLGIGGGSLLMLWLTLIVGMDADTARCVNLMFFVPSALCASIFKFKQGSLPFKKLVAPIIFGCLAAAVFSFARGSLDTGILKKIFGVLLLFTGVKELFYKEKRSP